MGEGVRIDGVGANVESDSGVAESRILNPVSCRIKICGITRVEDVKAVSKYGADAIGLVFYEKSPRHVTILRAVQLVAVLPPFVTVVGLFVNADPVFVREVLASVNLDLLQFHGEESPQYCEQFSKPYLKAIRVKEGVDLVQCAARFNTAKALLLDAYVEGTHGGTGAVFEWSLIPDSLRPQIILSGGLDSDNVGAAISAVRPYAVDVSSGVEASKGIKDADKIRAFVDAVRYANHKED
jgi:phosphoribosylanthranilate isomerase